MIRLLVCQLVQYFEIPTHLEKIIQQINWQEIRNSIKHRNHSHK